MKRTPKDNRESARRITRRGLILGGAQAGFMGLLALRMRYMQVDQAEEFRLLAEENRVNLRLLAPARGLIYDRNGVILAEKRAELPDRAGARGRRRCRRDSVAAGADHRPSA